MGNPKLRILIATEVAIEKENEQMNKYQSGAKELELRQNKDYLDTQSGMYFS